MALRPETQHGLVSSSACEPAFKRDGMVNQLSDPLFFSEEHTQ